MAGGDFLPPVVTRLEGDIGDLIKTVEEAKALIKSIGDTKIPVNVDTGGAISKLAALKAEFAKGVTVPIKFDSSAASAAGAGAAGAVAGRAGGNGAAMFLGGWRLTAQALHWIVMGTLEIASTALPALVALGAGVMAMVPAFTFAKDQMTNLVIASGSLSGAIRPRDPVASCRSATPPANSV